jgi:tripartite ATP-independent transporter DctP family solute receptor
MKRIILLTFVFTLVLAMGTLPCAQAADKPVKLVFASAYAPIDHQSKTLVKFGELAEQYSKGQLKVDVVVGGVLGGERDVAEGIQIGTVDGAILGGILQNFDPAMSILEFPFLFKNDAHVRAVMEGPVGEKIKARLIAKTGVRVLSHVMRTPRELTTKKPVKSLADLKGMKIRVPEMEAHLETWRALGATPTPLAFTEVYTALQLGTVDGQENPLGVIYANKFYEVADYLAISDHLVGFMMIVINNDKFNKLDPGVRQALAKAAVEASRYNDKLLKEINADIEKNLFAKMKVTKIDNAPWRDAAKDVYKRFLKYDGFEDLYLSIRKAGEKF